MRNFTTGWLSYDMAGTPSRAFSIRPMTSSPLPALMLIHGVNGLGPHIETHCAEFAENGYFVVAPDIYTNDPVFKTHDARDIEAAAHMGKDPAHHAAYLEKFPI